MQPSVELLYWTGCPSYRRALTELREIMDELGLDPQAVKLREVVTDEEAERSHFKGSPTILVEGHDVVGDGGAPVALACRVYKRRDGSISPLPDPDDIRDALLTRPPGAAVKPQGTSR